LRLIIDRLQSALTKLQKPEKTSNPETALEGWWREAEDHHASMGVEFRNLIYDGVGSPATSFTASSTTSSKTPITNVGWNPGSISP
jgi:hypothetical protein